MSLIVYSLALGSAEEAEPDPAWQAVLSSEERDRADRFRRAQDRRAFTAAHALVRLALAKALGERPERLAFFAAPGGKPMLRHAPSRVDFNLSHTNGSVAVAVSDGAVGIDVESTRRSTIIGLDLAQTAFGTRAAAALGPDPANPAWQHAFFSAWTAREAVLKAEGVGLAGAMDQIELGPTHAWFNGRRWRLRQRVLAPDHHLAVAWSSETEMRLVEIDLVGFKTWCNKAAYGLCSDASEQRPVDIMLGRVSAQR